MLKNVKKLKTVLYIAASVVLLVSLPAIVWSHCDTKSGPVALAAQKALKTGKFGTIAIWVGDEQSKELLKSFEESIVVYKMGGKAMALAERYFMETAVRLHREAEGMSYTGLKPARPLPPDIARAEKALETGNLRPVTDLLSMELKKETRKWFQKALDAQKNYKGESVETGREWVDSYVKYVIYVHGLHKKIQSDPEHGIGQ